MITISLVFDRANAHDLSPLFFSIHKQGRLGLGEGDGADASEAAASEAKSIYGRLIELDPLRAGFYRDAQEGKAFVVVSALGRGS